MPNCAACARELRTVRQEGGLFYLCDHCGGRAATIPQVRRAVGESYAKRLLHEINRASGVTPRKCPFCAVPMREFQNLETELVLDAGKACGVVWFDALEFEQASAGGRASGPNDDSHRSAAAGSHDTLTVEVFRSLANFLCLPF